MSQQGSQLDELTVRRYLLDELPQDEREQLEMRLLTDDEFFARLLELEETQEDELIDQYVSGGLSAQEHDRFKRVFLSTSERREKLDLVRDLSAYAATSVRPDRPTTESRKGAGRKFPFFLILRSPALGFALASALVIMALSSALLFFKVRDLESEVSRLKSAQASTPTPMPTPAPTQDVQGQLAQLQAHNAELEAALQRAEEQRARLSQQIASLKSQETRRPTVSGVTPRLPQEAPVVSLVLPLIQGRSASPGEIRELRLPAGAARVQLLLGLDVIDPRDYKDYRVQINKHDGSVAWRGRNPQFQNQDGEDQLVFNLPADRLPEGEYRAELSGVSGGMRKVIGVYTFRSLKQ